MQVDKEKLVKTLEERWKNVPCPYCGDHKWTVDPTIRTTIEVTQDKKMNFGGEFQPFVAVTCRCCGNTAFVNALVLDCIKEEE